MPPAMITRVKIAPAAAIVLPVGLSMKVRFSESGPQPTKAKKKAAHQTMRDSTSFTKPLMMLISAESPMTASMAQSSSFMVIIP